MMAALLIIQGHQADSQNEVNVARALDLAGLQYWYHYDIGDTSVRGGVELDFLVYNGALTIPVQVGVGGYFHSGSQAAEDLVKNLKIEDYGRRHGWDEMKEFTLEDSNTLEAARGWVRKEIL
jgi:hypothetical protein